MKAILKRSRSRCEDAESVVAGYTQEEGRAKRARVLSSTTIATVVGEDEDEDEDVKAWEVVDADGCLGEDVAALSSSQSPHIATAATAAAAAAAAATASHTALRSPNPTLSTPIPNESSPLFRLPPELRRNIYTHLFAAACPSLTDYLSSPSSSPSLTSLLLALPPDSEPPILHTSRRIRSEALPIFYSLHPFVLRIRPNVARSPFPRTSTSALEHRGHDRRQVFSKQHKDANNEEEELSDHRLPSWLTHLPDDKIAMMDSLVVVGSSGSFVDGAGRWKEAPRTTFLVSRAGLTVSVQEIIFGERETSDKGAVMDIALERDAEYTTAPLSKKDKRKTQKTGKWTNEHDDFVFHVRLVHLLRARINSFDADSSSKGKRWTWTRHRLRDIARLL